ncbi:MAG TPA: WGR domain-containing protein [Kofleriaceae bacterium]|nr:WGR domain-containing protein [Kofleriaceae bacterium]
MVTKASAGAAGKKIKIPVDSVCPLKGAAVHEDYDCMLNQTNIGANNNTFYVIQLLVKDGKYYAWTRWGRVGEDGQNALLGPSDFGKALKAFQAKFKDKTKNAWEDRADFKPAAGRYTLIEVDRSVDESKAEELEEKLKGIDADAAKIQAKTAKKFAPSKLAPETQKFMDLIFDEDMFKGAMASFDIDVKKMPLGQLSKSQVEKGFEVLEDLEDAIKGKKSKSIEEVSSRFYTVIPHAFGRRVPPPIDTMELLQKKFEMLNVLGDIEIAVTLQKADASKTAKLAPHPADENYAKLNAELDLVDPKSSEYEMIENYIEATARAGRKPKLLNLFRLDRKGEAKRFNTHDDLDNRKLLWHGTNVAVVAAICKTGLRIMPHSGGRVGKGIYLASENGKSINYMGWATGGHGVMFLAEGALGKEHSITRDDSSLKAAPKGFHSIVARGQKEPDPAKDITFKYEGKDVVVPQGKPIAMKQYAKSSFDQSEYLVYQESQVRLRYALQVKI